MNDDITQAQIDVLSLLRAKSRSFRSIGELSTKLKLSNQKVESALAELEHWGYEFLYNKSGLVRYAASPDILFPHEIGHDLESTVLGSNIYSFDRVGSTNEIAHKYAEKGEPEGTLIVAERQTAGKGRLGRSWHSPAKRGIYMSLILRPQIPPNMAPGLSLIAALGVTQVIREYPQITATIKWPNDVLCGKFKVAGVLTELSAEIDRIKYVIVGIGINVNHEEDDFPPDLTDKASSLKIISHSRVDRVRLIRMILTRLEGHYDDYVRNGFKRLLKPIKSYSSVLGKQICFSHDRKSLEGRAIDIDANGLLVVDVNGKTMSLSSGEVSLTEDYRN